LAAPQGDSPETDVLAWVDPLIPEEYKRIDAIMDHLDMHLRIGISTNIPLSGGAVGPFANTTRILSASKRSALSEWTT